MSRYLYPFLQTLWKNQFSSATLILVTALRFIGALENLASQSRAKKENLFHDIETTIKTKLGNILEKLTQRHNRREQARFDINPGDCDNEICASTQFLQIQKNQLIDLQETLDHYCKVLPVFAFNTAECDLILIKCYLAPNLVNEQEIEPTVIKKANHFISFEFGIIQLLEIFIFHGGASSLDSFLKANRTSEKRVFPLRMVWSPWQIAEYGTSPIWRLLQ